jgi:hypothetical protein
MEANYTDTIPRVNKSMWLSARSVKIHAPGDSRFSISLENRLAPIGRISSPSTKAGLCTGILPL